MNKELKKGYRVAFGSMIALNGIIMILIGLMVDNKKDVSLSLIASACLLWVSMIQIAVVSTRTFDKTTLDYFTKIHIAGCIVIFSLLILAYYGGFMIGLNIKNPF